MGRTVLGHTRSYRAEGRTGQDQSLREERSELPVEVAQLGYSVYTTWVVPEGEGVWYVVPGTVPVRCFPEDFIVRPGHTYEVTPYEPNVAHTECGDQRYAAVLRSTAARS